MILNPLPAFLGGAAEGASTSIAPEWPGDDGDADTVDAAAAALAAATLAPHFTQKGEPVKAAPHATQTLAGTAGAEAGSDTAFAGVSSGLSDDGDAGAAAVSAELAACETFAPHFTQKGEPAKAAPHAAQTPAETPAAVSAGGTGGASTCGRGGATAAVSFESDVDSGCATNNGDETFAPHLTQNGEPVSTALQAGQTAAARAGSAVGAGGGTAAGPTFAPHFTQKGEPVSAEPQAGHAFPEAGGAGSAAAAGAAAEPTFAPHFTQNGEPVSPAPQAGHAFAAGTDAAGTTTAAGAATTGAAGGDDTGAAAWPTFVPHFTQNTLSGGSVVPHPVQNCFTGAGSGFLVPHFRQNTSSSASGNPHELHGTAISIELPKGL